MRARAGSLLPMRDGGGAVELIVALLSSCMFLPSHASLAALCTTRGNCSAWKQEWATAAFHPVVALAGLPATEYALQSLRIGSATFFLVGGALADVVQREGRWKANTYKDYERSHGVDAQAVSDMLADADAQPALQPD